MTSRSARVVPFRHRRARRDDVSRQLAAARPSAAQDGRWAAEARGAFEGLGPVFCAFAAYIGSRIDLLSAADCCELARTRHLPRLHSPEALLTGEISELTAQLAHVEPMPIGMSAATQTHHARLIDGTTVLLEILSPWVEEAGEDLDLLPLTEAVFTPRVSRAALLSAISDFRAWFSSAVDLDSRLALLERAASDPLDCAPLVSPAPLSELCSSRVLVLEIPAEDLWTAMGGARRDGAAVMTTWLRLALFGVVCPVFAPEDAQAFANERRVAPTLMRVPPALQHSLLRYLFAAAAEMPDRAWAMLRPQLRVCSGAAPSEEVLRVFRRLVPFRDDRRTETGSAAADRVFLQWRTASRHGWMPGGDLAAFYRGMFAMACATAREPSDSGDVLAEAIGALRLSADARQVDEWVAAADPMMALEGQMALLMEVPQKLDRLLTTAADGALRVHLVTGDGAVTTRRNRAAMTMAVMLMVAAAVVLAGAVPTIRQAWASESARSVAFMVVGAVLVWAVGRIR